MGTKSLSLCITQASVSWLNKHFFFAAIAITHACRISTLSKFSADNFGRTVCRDLYHLGFDIGFRVEPKKIKFVGISPRGGVALRKKLAPDTHNMQNEVLHLHFHSYLVGCTWIVHFFMMQWPPLMILPLHNTSNPPINLALTLLIIIIPHSLPVPHTLLIT